MTIDEADLATRREAAIERPTALAVDDPLMRGPSLQAVSRTATPHRHSTPREWG